MIIYPVCYVVTYVGRHSDTLFISAFRVICLFYTSTY